jgi:hypothetical protein
MEVSCIEQKDWYDFIWYVGKKTSINFILLKEALVQTGHWTFDKHSPMTKQFFIELLRNKITTIDWKKASEDVKPFIRPMDQGVLSLWSTHYFLSYINKLETYLE